MTDPKRLVRSELKYDMSDFIRFKEYEWPIILEGATDEALNKSLDQGRIAARRHVRKDTRSLMKSIRKWRKVASLLVGTFVGGLRAGGFIRNPKTGRLVDYAAIIEQLQKDEDSRGYIEIGMMVAKRMFPIFFAQIVKRRIKRYG